MEALDNPVAREFRGDIALAMIFPTDIAKPHDLFSQHGDSNETCFNQGHLSRRSGHPNSTAVILNLLTAGAYRRLGV